jgi:hypothetical protein
MNRQLFDIKDLPIDSLADLGLTINRYLLLDQVDQRALLSGRRTQLVELRKLEFADMKIESLQAKLSLAAGITGKPELMIHPIYLRPVIPPYLLKHEADLLKNGMTLNLEKVITDHSETAKNMLIEFDRETNQFLETDEDKLIPPDEVNGYPLTAEQKKQYIHGEIVEIKDYTRFQYTATNREGLRANRNELIMANIEAGEHVYASYYNLRTLRNYHHDFQEVPPGNAYLNALAKMQTKEMEASAEQQMQNENPSVAPNSRGRSR